VEIREVFAAIRSAWWLPAAGLLLGSIAALVLGLLQTPQYSATTRLFVTTPNSSTPGDSFQGNEFSRQRVNSYAQLITSKPLAAAVIDSLGLSMTPDELASKISAAPVTNTVLLDVTVTDPSPERARDVAGAVGTQFSRLVTKLETAPGATTAPVTVSVVDPPALPVVASSPETMRNLVLGALLGLVAGVAAAVARLRHDRSVRDPEAAAALVGGPVIGLVARDPDLEQCHLFTRAHAAAVAEDYRQLRTNLEHLDVDPPPRTIMVSSAVPSEGKTTLVINLAIALAEAGRRVTVVDADLRQPQVNRYLNMEDGAGLTNVLDGSADLEDVAQSYGDDGNLFVVAAGPTPPNPSELLASTRMATMIEQLKARNDFVLVDAPPLLSVAEASGLGAIVDGVVLSVRYGTTREEELRKASRTLDRVGATILGLVFNIVPQNAEIASGYGLRYGYVGRQARTTPRQLLTQERPETAVRPLEG
jgi:capsular exopolysaccharide synthesis family protein